MILFSCQEKDEKEVLQEKLNAVYDNQEIIYDLLKKQEVVNIKDSLSIEWWDFTKDSTGFWFVFDNYSYTENYDSIYSVKIESKDDISIVGYWFDFSDAEFKYSIELDEKGDTLSYKKTTVNTVLLGDFSLDSLSEEW